MISIIVPVYKVEAFLTQCVNSILQQTFRNFELILVDDGSPDNCPALCDAYAKQDNRVKVIHQKNGGPMRAVLSGLNVAHGDYIFFVDSDDWIDYTMLEQMHTIMVSGAYDLVTCSYVKEGPYRSDPMEGFSIRSGAYQQQQIKDEIFPCLLYKAGKTVSAIAGSRWGKLFRRDLLLCNLTYYHADISHGEDFLITIPYLLSSASLYLIPNAYLYHYRTNPTSITQTYHPKLFCESYRLSTYFEQIVKVLAPEQARFCDQIKYLHLYDAYCCIQSMRQQFFIQPAAEIQQLISDIVSHPSLDRTILDRSLPLKIQLQCRLIQHKNVRCLYWFNWMLEKRRLRRQCNGQ